MKHIFDRLTQLTHERIATRLKHLRGQHDQRDHAWNRGMGGGGASGSGKRGGGAGVELGPNQMGPLLTTPMYRQQRQQLQQQLRDGVITRAEMQAQLQNLRGITAEPSRRDSASVLFASRRNSPLSNLNKKVDFGEDLEVLTKQERLQKIKDYRTSVFDKQEEMMAKINALIAQAAQSSFYTDNLVNTTVFAPAESGGLPWEAVNEIIKAYRPIRSLAQTLEYLNRTGKITFPDSVDERDIGIGNTMALDTSVLDTLVQKHRSEITEFLNENFDTTVTNGFNAFINPNRSASFLSDIAIPKEILIAYNDLIDHVDVVSAEIGAQISEISREHTMSGSNPVLLLMMEKQINQEISELRADKVFAVLSYPEKAKLEKQAETLKKQIRKADRELLKLEMQSAYAGINLDKHKRKLSENGINDSDEKLDELNTRVKELELKMKTIQKSLDELKKKLADNVDTRNKRQDEAYDITESGLRLKKLEAQARGLSKQISETGSTMLKEKATFMHEIFSALAHPNPYNSTVVDSISDKLPAQPRKSQKEVDELEAIYQQVIKDTMSMFPDIASQGDMQRVYAAAGLVIPPTSIFAGSDASIFTDKYTRMQFTFNPATGASMNLNTGTMAVTHDADPDVYSHETIHYMQMVFNQLYANDMSYRLAPWIEKRIEREEIQPISMLRPGYPKDSGMGFKDSVDNPYTLRYYGRTESKLTPSGVISTYDLLQKPDFANYFYEVQSTAFDDLWDAHKRVDRELLPIALSSIFLISADENVRKIQKRLFDMLNR